LLSTNHLSGFVLYLSLRDFLRMGVERRVTQIFFSLYYER
jgi:hypothetical protein